MRRKEELIEALKKERNQFKARNQSTLDHDYAIEFLETGNVPYVNPDDYEILDACMYDYETMVFDYLES